MNLTLAAITARHVEKGAAMNDCCALMLSPDVYGVCMYRIEPGNGLPLACNSLAGVFSHWLIVAHMRRWEVN